MSTDELIELAQNGDKSAKIELWVAFKKWIAIVCKRYIEFAKQSGNDLDDLINQSYIAFDKALYKYDRQSEYSFSTLLTYYVRREIRQYLSIRSGKPILMPISLDESIDEDNELTRLDLIEDESAANEYKKAEARLNMAQLLNNVHNLSEQQLNVVLWYYRDGVSLKVIADRLKVSVSRVGHIKRDALSKLRNSQVIKEAYYEEYAYVQTRFSTFVKTHTSAVEYAVLKLERERYKTHRLKNTKGYFYYDL